ncbi:hypothetical protein STSP_28320 [Streptomyces jeddahensis]|uniref:Uncharacterized protein n=1 Tax=Streptomyces jeddahensis TaxID=1716141 RepID=A0A177HUG1_9ACTN|nr:hypothetical protein STSP_28320 [Streptomyces jeddahensis]
MPPGVVPGASPYVGQAVALRYLRTARVRKTAMISTDQMSEAQTGCCMGHADESTTPGFPT